MSSINRSQTGKSRRGSQQIWDGQARMRVGSLFERLVHDEEDRDFPSELDPTAAQVASIKRHLVNLLNTRVGGSASAPGLGVSDFNDGSVESNDMIKHIEWSIAHCIKTYEPRVANAEVESQANPDDPLDFRFRIFCDVLVGSDKERVQVDLMMDRNSKLKLA